MSDNLESGKKKYTINVTQRDIDNWAKRRPLKDAAPCDVCAVAQALHRIKALKAYRVGYVNIYLDNSPTGKFNIFLPDDIINKITAMDAGEKEAPFKFTIEV